MNWAEKESKGAILGALQMLNEYGRSHQPVCMVKASPNSTTTFCESIDVMCKEKMFYLEAASLCKLEKAFKWCEPMLPWPGSPVKCRAAIGAPANKKICKYPCSRGVALHSCQPTSLIPSRLFCQTVYQNLSIDAGNRNYHVRTGKCNASS